MVGEGIGRDVHLIQENFPPLDAREALLEAGLAGPDGFDLRPIQNYPRLQGVQDLEEELGDVLLQVIFHAQLAAEKGRFTIEDVVRSQIRKLTLRHPHVFGYKAEHRRRLKGRSLRTSGDVLANWDVLKAISRKS